MNFLCNLRVGARLSLGFAILILLGLVAGAIGIQRIETVRGIADRLGGEDVETLTLAQGWLRAIESNTARSWVVFFAVDPAAIARVKQEMQVTVTEQAQRIKRMTALAVSDESKRLIAEISTQRDAFQAMRNDLLKRKDAGEDVGAQVVGRVFPSAQAYLASVQRLVDHEAQGVKATRDAADRAAAQGIAALVGGTVLALLAGVAMAWAITRSIVRPVRQAQARVEAIAAGDLRTTAQEGSRDEIGELMRSVARMVESLRAIVDKVRSGADTIALATHEIATGNADLSHRTEQQASNLQQTAAAMAQMNVTVKNNADAARHANELAASASAAAGKGGEVVGQVVATMEEITSSSRRIADIVGVIDGIAFQTNILALNAAVEAARAGDQGRGFAVVASEVRSLAQRSAGAAREIKSLISASVEKVETGSKLVGDAGTTMDDIVAQVHRVSELIGEISASTLEQTGGIAQVSGAVSHLDNATQQNAALVEQSAAAADSLKEQARSLVQSVSVFRLSKLPSEEER